MHIISVENKALVFNEEERRKLKFCIDYCWHRLEKHQNTGLHKVKMDIPFVDRLRKQLDNRGL